MKTGSESCEQIQMSVLQVFPVFPPFSLLGNQRSTFAYWLPVNQSLPPNDPSRIQSISQTSLSLLSVSQASRGRASAAAAFVSICNTCALYVLLGLHLPSSQQSRTILAAPIKSGKISACVPIRPYGAPEKKGIVRFPEFCRLDTEVTTFRY